VSWRLGPVNKHTGLYCYRDWIQLLSQSLTRSHHGANKIYLLLNTVRHANCSKSDLSMDWMAGATSGVISDH
jgi:hypothetical protein